MKSEDVGNVSSINKRRFSFQQRRTLQVTTPLRRPAQSGRNFRGVILRAFFPPPPPIELSSLVVRFFVRVNAMAMRWSHVRREKNTCRGVSVYRDHDRQVDLSGDDV